MNPELAVPSPGTKPPKSGEPKAKPQTRDHSDARFMSRAGVNVLGAVLRTTSNVSTRAGAQLAYRILSNPPRFKAPSREYAAYSSALHGKVPFGNRSLKTYEWGRGPSVLLVHSWGGRSTQFSELIGPLVDAGYRVIGFDAPAHGESRGRRTDMFDCAEAIAAVARTFGPLHAVIGHSFGAGTAMMARRSLELSADRFVLVSMFESCAWFVDAFGKYFRVTPRVIELMIANFDRRRGTPVDWSELSMLKIIASIDEPVLLIHDRNDSEIPFSHAEMLKKASKNATLLPTDGLGHRRILRDASVIEKTIRFLGIKKTGVLE